MTGRLAVSLSFVTEPIRLRTVVWPTVEYPGAYRESVEGTPFGRYRLIELLGRGGMGEVWRAFDTGTERVVALKVLPANLADDGVFQERFRREARIAAGLDEPHVVPIHDFGEIDGRLYVTMRLIKGRDLQAILANGPLEPGRAVSIIEQVAHALNAAHEVGLVHRDVKPSNILVTDTDFAYLIDFGIARAVNDTGLTSTGAVIGTWAYMSPERLDTGRADARADIYALTCVLHESLTGQPPYPGHSMESQITAHLTKPPPRPSAIRHGLPAAFDAVIARGMAKNPDQRYDTTLTLAAHARSVMTAPNPQSVRQQPSPSQPTPTTLGGMPPPPVSPQPMVDYHFHRPTPAPTTPPPFAAGVPPSYSGGNSASFRTPEEKLASRSWRWLNSWWILPPILSLGFLSWLGFLVAAVRTGKPKYWVFCVIYASLFVLAIAMVETSKGSLTNNLSPIPIFAAWLGPTIHAAIMNREYLRTLAYKNA